LIQWAAIAEKTLADLAGLYATEMKSTFRPRAASKSLGSPPRGGEKSQMNRGPVSRAYLSVTLVKWLHRCMCDRLSRIGEGRVKSEAPRRECQVPVSVTLA